MNSHPTIPKTPGSAEARPGGLKRALGRIRCHGGDRLRYSASVRRAFALASAIRGRVTRSWAGALEHDLNAFRFADPGSKAERRHRIRMRERLERPGLETWRSQQIGWDRFHGWKREGPVTRTLVLKAPGEGGEKGILLTSFEYNWFKILRDEEVARELESRYDFIFSTTSSPGDYAMIGLALETLRGPVYVMSCHYDEMAKFEAFHPRVKCLPMLPCDWLEPELYRPKAYEDRQIDILMVAGWGPVKRHWHFFEALRSLPADKRVVLVGQPDGRFDRQHIVDLAREIGVPQDLEIRESLAIDEVTALQSDSRISAIFSRREGCCVAVVESMMADSPVALVEGTHMGPAAYINEKTGRFLPLRNTGAALHRFLEESGACRARNWAVENISNVRSAKNCDAFFAEERHRRGEKWSGGIAVPRWRPHPVLPEESVTPALRQAFKTLHREFPSLFAADLIVSSCR